MSRGVVLTSLLTLACGATAADRPGRDRPSQGPAITEAVLRYEVRQFAGTPHEAAGELACVGVADTEKVRDPSAELLQRLGPRVKPRSACDAGAALLLVAGPIEWLNDSEVRVKGSFSHGTSATTRLEYRVVWETGNWKCLGPVIGYDPL